MTHALFLALSLLAAEPTSGTITVDSVPLGALLYGDNQDRFCKADDGTNEYEPCAWHDEREAAAERAKREAEDKAKAKATCIVKGCFVVRQRVMFEYLTYPPSYPPDWRCDCNHKPQKKEAKKP